MSTRVSTSQMFGTATAQVAGARERDQKAAEKAATQKELSRPSEDPTGYVIAANLKDDLDIRETVSRNASLAMHVLQTTDGVLGRVQDYVQRLHEISLSCAGTDPASLTARNQSITEAKSLYEGMVQTLNTKFGARTLLAGIKGQGEAFNMAGEFVGEPGDIQVQIDRDLKLPINVSGERAILGQGLTNGVNILDATQRLINGIAMEDTDLIRSAVGDLAKSTDQISVARGEVGGRMSQIDKSISTNGEIKIAMKDSISKIEDVDVIKAYSDLTQGQTALKASISTSQKILSENPVDILFR